MLRLRFFHPARQAARLISFGRLLLLLAGIAVAAEQPSPTSIDLFVDHGTEAHRGPEVTVPQDASTLAFSIKPQSALVRYKLEGIDQDWKTRTEKMFFMVRFLNERGDQLSQVLFPVSGRSAGWKGSLEASNFTPRNERVSVPPDAVYLSVAMSSAGPASLVGLFAVTGINIRSVGEGGAERVFMADSRAADPQSYFWIKSGTHPSMASGQHLEDGDKGSPVLIIMDDDITRHADWASNIHALPKLTPGELLEVQWKEAYSIGEGGNFSATYERLPPGPYRFLVENLTITGAPLGSVT